MCGSRLPGLAGRRRQPSTGGRWTVLSDSIRPRVVDVEQRQRAGAGELRDVVGGLEGLLAVHRHREGQAARARRGRAQRRAPQTRSRTRNGSSHQNSASSGSTIGGGHGDLGGKPGEHREQERNGVGVDQHDVDEVGAHDQDVLLELRQQDQHHDHDERQRAATAGRRSTASQTKLSRPQASRNASRGTRSSSVWSRTPSAAMCSSTSAAAPKRERRPAGRASLVR